MATELGQAYIQIMPSAKGISGSIQKTINPEATAAGKSAGSRIASSISDSLGKAGKTLTKSITLPALGAATAVGGVVASFGWKRLVGLDSARSQLQGLGYDAESVERISAQVNDAIQGTVTTMAEGVSIAAGGLAAGVEEGAELEKYIQLVGDAAVGANRPVNDMAQIFNRVQGSGKMMTQELNMIEDGMPGFAMAMAKSLGVSQEEFRKMVTDGKVTSKQFLGVMDSFAGEMSGAYANSWQGMVSNTKAWIGIIGENILGGVFEKSKEAIGEFMEYLKSDDVQAWAKETGATVGEAFTNLIETVKDAIKWWMDLDDGTKSLIGKLAGIAVVAGPIMLVISKIVTTIMSLIPLFKAIGFVIGAITSPIGLIVAAIIGAAALIYIYWEPIKKFFIDLWEAIKESAIAIWDVLKDWWSNSIEFFKNLWGAIPAFFTSLWETVMTVFQNVWDTIIGYVDEKLFEIEETFNDYLGFIISIISDAWEFLYDIWSSALGFILGDSIDNFTELKTFFDNIMGGIWEIVESAWVFISDSFSNAVGFIMALVRLDFGVMKQFILQQLDTIKLFVGNVWNAIKTIFSNLLSLIVGVIKEKFNQMINSIKSVMSSISSVISSIWNSILSIISSITSSISSFVSSIFNGLVGIVSGAFSAVAGAVKNGMTTAFNTVKGFLGKFKDAGKNIVTSIAQGITGAIGKVTDAISNVTSKIRDFLPFSPPKTGPLIDIMDVKWGETIAGGIDKGEGTVAKAMDSLLDFDLTKKANFHNSNGFSGVGQNDVTQLLLELIDAVKDGQNISLFPNGGTFAKRTGDYTSQEGGNRIRRHERGLA